MLPDAQFLDEAIANLDAMDAVLAGFGPAADPDAVHAVFRHAHSIKGGAAAFGMEAVAELMHAIESVLDVSRSTGLPTDGTTTGMLRDAVDAARHMLVDDGALTGALGQEIAMQLRQRAAAPQARQGGSLRRITIRSAETDVVSAAVIGLFADIAGLGELLSVDRSARGEQVFVVRTMSRDPELLDLLAMHVERASVSIAAVPVAPDAAVADVSDGVSAASEGGATVRVDAAALRRLVLLARNLARADVQLSQWQRGLGALCRGLEELGSAPASSLFGRIPPLLLRLSGQLNKEFDLSVTGDDVRIDRAVLQRLADPLMHLVRNACDHGIEPEPQRRSAGKPRAGRIDVAAWRESGRVRISVRDDGAGLSRYNVLRAARERAVELPDDLDDQAVWQLVFLPGLSTAPSLSQVSGRGVGMDVVQRQVASMGGDVSISSSAGKGVCVTMSIPVDEAPDLTADD